MTMAVRLLPSLARCAPPTARRTYATSASSSSSSLPLILGGVALAAGGGYWYTSGGKIPAPKDLKDAEHNMAEKVKAVAGYTSTDSTPLTTSALDPNEFREFTLSEVIPYNHNSSRFVFSLPEGTDSGLKVASCLVTKSADGTLKDDKGKDVIRPYTTTTAPNAKGKLELLIKKYKDGKMSTHIFNLKPGDKLAMKGPIPKFPYKPNEFEQVAFIVGGSGVTPAWQTLQAIESNPEDKTKATLIFSNVTEEDILLRKEFESLATKKPDQFKIVFTLDKPPKGWTGPSGFLNQETLGKYLPGAGMADKVKVFVCGPPPMVNAISGGKASMKDQGPLKGLLADLGYQASQVYKF